MPPKLVTHPLFQRYLHGTCSPQEAALLRDYLSRPANEEQLADWMRDHWESLDVAPMAVPQEQAERLLQALHIRLGFRP